MRGDLVIGKFNRQIKGESMFDPKTLDLPAVIIDSGSWVCKGGIAGDCTPRSAVTSVVGRPTGPTSTRATRGCEREYYVGEEARAKDGVLSLNYPLTRGIVQDWDDMEKIWRHVYERDLRMQSSERPVLLTERPLNPLTDREKVTEVMFESFEVPAMFVAVQAVLALYASGRTTGMVLDSGEGVTHVVPVYDGYCLPHAVSRLDVAGKDVSEHLTKLLMASGTAFLGTSDVVEELKERLCYVALDPTSEAEKRTEETEKTFQLPDGNTVKIGNALFRAPEALFHPLDVGVEALGIDKLTWKSITKCDLGIRNTLQANILIAGGSTLFPGFEERLLKEMRLQAPSELSLKIIAPPDRKYSVWLGASILTCLSAFKQMWVTVDDYKEFGPAVVHRKCY
nr:PREDICTED: actin-related protein T2 [Lepisosteus oculatus]